MAAEEANSLGGQATFAGKAARPQRADVSLGDERTLGGGNAAGLETVIDEMDVVDLEARYRVEGTLGQGGMGAVLLATDTRLGRKVAIKRILGEAARNKTAIMRFLTEAKAVATLNHPNIVQIFDYGRAKDGPFLIMEYVDGGSLADFCKAGSLPPDQAIELIGQVCDGLGLAHAQGIVHRDIKPANILISRSGAPKLTDFGLAKAEANDHGMTMTGAVMGTPDFMPPEQQRNASEVDHRSDLWSLAATLYQAVTGRSPRVIRLDLLPASLTKVIGKALEDEQDARYQSARDFYDALKPSVRGGAVVVQQHPEGTCTSCGVSNESSRRFCRGCGETLEAPCLSCTKPMPTWEEICGSCGAKQSPLIAEQRQAMATQQAEAEGLLGDCQFDRASAIADRLRNGTHLRCRDVSGWAASFLRQIEDCRAERTRDVVEAITEARKHEATHDYASAKLALQRVPASMCACVMTGAPESAASIFARLRETEAEVRRLDSLIKQRRANQSLDDLLPEVEKLLELRPGYEDLETLREQIIERQKRRIADRDGALETARACLAAQDYRGALAALNAVPAQDANQEIRDARAQAQTLAGEADTLARKIREAVQTKRLNTLLADVESYLRLQPADSDISGLRRSMLHRDRMLAEARSSLAYHKYDDALTAVSSVDTALCDATVCEIKHTAEDALRRIAKLSASLWPGDGHDVDQEQRLQLVEELLLLKPDHALGLQLKSDLAAAQRDDIAKQRHDLLERSRSLMADKQYEKVLQSLSDIRPDLDFPDLEAAREEARRAIRLSLRTGRSVIRLLDEEQLEGIEQALADYLQTNPCSFRDSDSADQLLARARRLGKVSRATKGNRTVFEALVYILFTLILTLRAIATAGPESVGAVVGLMGVGSAIVFAIFLANVSRHRHRLSAISHSMNWAIIFDLRTLANSLPWSPSPQIPSREMLIHDVNQLDRKKTLVAAGQVCAAEMFMNPSDVRGWVGLATCYARSHQLREAITTLEMAEKRFPPCGLVYYNLACYLARLKDLSYSLSCLRKAIALEPRYRIQAVKDHDFAAVRSGAEFKRTISERVGPQ